MKLSTLLKRLGMLFLCMHMGLKGTVMITVTSSAFTQGADIPKIYSCDGKSYSPPLAWSGIPAETKSIVLIVDDPDAPGGTFVHWVAYNIPVTSQGLPEGFSKDKSITELYPEAREGINSGKTKGYYPMCPPSGWHRYFFKVYALGTTLTLSDRATKQELEDAMKGHVLTQGQLIGRYKKQS